MLKLHKLVWTRCINKVLRVNYCGITGCGIPYLNRRVSSTASSIKKEVAQRKYIKRSSGPGLEYFLVSGQSGGVVPGGGNDIHVQEVHPYISNQVLDGTGKKVYIEVYGCQMNVNDTEIIFSILSKYNYCQTSAVKEADVVLLMTCAIREGAEHKIWHRLSELKAIKKSRKSLGESALTVGVIGCMAERLKDQLLEKEQSVDVIAGPDSYRQLPFLLSQVANNQAAIDVILSLDETYADVVPVRLNPNSPSAYVSIMRGCDNMCTYCIVPFTRGKERSRPIDTILDEVRHLSEQGIKEITLLGQNVNSYRDTSESIHYGCAGNEVYPTAAGFSTVYKAKVGGRRFVDLLDKVSGIDSEIRFRFTSPHPKDFPTEVVQLIRDRANICKSLHLPAQSGNDRILDLMRRNYTRQAYLDLVDNITSACPDVTFSSDFICGFCSETEQEFQDTVELMEKVPYSMAYIFAYSLRQKTTAHRRYEDDVPLDVKKDRVHRLTQIFRQRAQAINRRLIGSIQLVLVEGDSKKSDAFLVGRNDGNVRVIFAKPNSQLGQIKPGDYVAVRIHDANSQVLKGEALDRCTLSAFHGSLNYSKCLAK